MWASVRWRPMGRRACKGNLLHERRSRDACESTEARIQTAELRNGLEERSIMSTLPSTNTSRCAIYRTRTALIASADTSFRQRVQQALTGLRWQVREAGSGAEAWAASQATLPAAMIVDAWL